MDPRLAPVPVLNEFAEALPSALDVVGLYVGGSLAAGDYRPGVSDLDVLAVTATAPNDKQTQQLGELHRRAVQRHPSAAKLHCAYLPRVDTDDVSAPHLYWAQQQFYRRRVTGVARAEVLRFGITVFGPPPSTLLPDVDDASLRRAARAELTGYWAGAVRKPTLWLRDLYVDLGLLTLARAEATLIDGSLITKRDAITRLDRFEADAALVEEIRRRRAGELVHLGHTERLWRAYIARRLVARGIRRLTSEFPLE